MCIGWICKCFGRIRTFRVSKQTKSLRVSAWCWADSQTLTVEMSSSGQLSEQVSSDQGWQHTPQQAEVVLTRSEVFLTQAEVVLT